MPPVTQGTGADCQGADHLIEGPIILIADKGYDTNHILKNALEQGMDHQRKIAAINAPAINTCTKSCRKRFFATLRHGLK